MINVLVLPKNSEKDVFTLKTEGNYYAVVSDEEAFYIVPTLFDSPLRAANFGRALRKSLDLKIKKKQKTKNADNTSKILRKKHLYTEAEMSSETRLKFREVWLIVSPDEQYVGEVLTDNKVVKYVGDKSQAFTFKTYEEATLNLKTLDMVIKRGHRLKRFFERRD